MKPPMLLRHLAQFGSFDKQAELLCTQGLAYVLQTYKEAHSALAAKVVEDTGSVIGDSVTWVAEAVQPDRARVDLEAQNGTIPILKIEAKLRAELSKNQVRSYAQDLVDRNKGKGVLLLLVPEWRISEITTKTAEALALTEPGHWRLTDQRGYGAAVISWDELFTVLQSGESERFHFELDQLEAMYRVLSGDDILPLADEDDLRKWRAREEDFWIIVDRVTRRLTTKHQTYPEQNERLTGVASDSEVSRHRFRYVCPLNDSCFSIGVRDPFKGSATPIWMRFHGGTGNFVRIHQRIKAARVKFYFTGGHVWIPLEVPFDVSGEQIIKALSEKAKEVMRVAYQAD